jgi:tRNA wybutosine-synthesizing protein 1
MTHLGANALLAPVFGDDASDLLTAFRSWSLQVDAAMIERAGRRPSAAPPSSGCCQEKPEADCGCASTTSRRTDGVKRLKGTKRTKRPKSERAQATSSAPSTGLPLATTASAADEEAEEEDLINDTFVMDSDDEEENAACGSGGEDEGIVDLEDIGPTMAASAADSSKAPLPEREMVTKLQRKALTKEGYKIIGTHSAVKMCRWTKNQMRGRGGCYKHSFYGITSYQCMEATPSLACANKCVFCWRHHKNPVGTEWRWKTDPPSMIVDQAIEEHRGMVNQMKGVPGVVPERYQEAFTVRHCALSLVGEPIMYPHINEMLRLLHARKISSFLVTNAQFPEAIRTLDPVTQLYVSIDAATKESLKAVDRPLFKDFWERFRQSLLFMREKQQRTVYRMTLVKSYNMDEVEQYCDLIQEGEPDLIEIKAVTYCGKSDASSLTMKNVPWHYEVCSYAEAIVATLNSRPNCRIKYGIATEHEHSCCILIAREDRFLVEGQWHTWIDYPKFDELIAAYYESNGSKTFTSTDYLAPTPDWALYKSSERGFDPVESRYRRTKTGALVEVEYKSSESGCG